MFLCGAASLEVLPFVPVTAAALLPMSVLVGFMGTIPGLLIFCTLVFPSDLRLQMRALVTVLARCAGLVAPAAAGIILAAVGSGSLLFFIARMVAAVAVLSVSLSGLLARSSDSVNNALG